MEPQAGSKTKFFLTCDKTSLINLHIENRISYLSIKKVERDRVQVQSLNKVLILTKEYQPIIN